MKNRAYHHGIKCSPYEAMFGQPMKCGLKTSNLPDDVINDISTEEELEKLISMAATEESSHEGEDYEEIESSEITTAASSQSTNNPESTAAASPSAIIQESSDTTAASGMHSHC